jgi:hypothetical protein
VVIGGAVIGALAWIDLVFVPLVLLGPIVWGAVEGWRRRPWRWVLGVWAFAGVTMIVSDWIVNEEDVAFHVVLTVVMTLLAAAAWVGAYEILRRRRPASRARVAR